MRYPKQLIKLIETLKKLPGVGTRSAERFAFQMLNWSPHQLEEFAKTVKETPLLLNKCTECGCLIDAALPCNFCTPERAKRGTLCIVASPKDVFSIEETHEYFGLYHALGGLLSPIDGKRPEQLPLPKIKERVQQYQLKEVVIALDSTLEGDTTALYLKQELEPLALQVSRLAFGLPMGSSLDYIDGGTLARAFSGRLKF